jgi:hypothetical protein
MLWTALLVALTLVCGLIPVGFAIPHSPVTQKELFFITGIVWIVWQSWVSRGYTKEVYCHYGVWNCLTLQSLLASHGVKAFISNDEALGRLFPVTIGALGVKRIMVSEESFVKAREVVSSIA